jgi:hypothetical protein
MTKATIQRIVLMLLLGVLLGAALTELTFRFLKRDQDRQPETITLTIPAGTAARVANGETPPTIPDTMVFVLGDILKVVNEDSANHQLGPLFIPAKATATLSFDALQEYAYTCSFRADRYLGLSVRAPLTLNDRIVGILSAGLPMGVLMALYAVFAFGSEKQKGASV